MEEENKNNIDVDKQLDESSKKIREQMNGTKKKKFFDRDFSWVIIVLLGLGVFGLSYALQQTKGAITTTGLIVVYVIVCLLIGVLVYALGRLIFGSIAKYKLRLIEILGISFIFTNNGVKTKFEFSKILEARMLMCPKDENSNPNPSLYFFGGLITSVIFAGVLLGISFANIDAISTKWKILLQFGVGISSMVAIYEILPISYANKNDCSLFILTRGENNIKAYNNYIYNKGQDLMHEYLIPFQVETYQTKLEYWTILGSIEEAIYNNQDNKALELVNLLEEEPYIVPSAIYCEAAYQKLYILLTNRRSKEAAEYVVGLEKKAKNAEDYHMSISALRVDILVSGLIENSLDSTKEAISQFKKACSKIGITQRVEKEYELVNNFIPKLNAAHPDWKLENISIEEQKKEKVAEKEDSEDD